MAEQHRHKSHRKTKTTPGSGPPPQSKEELDRFAWRDDLEATDDEMASVAWTVVALLSATLVALTLLVYLLW